MKLRLNFNTAAEPCPTCGVPAGVWCKPRDRRGRTPSRVCEARVLANQRDWERNPGKKTQPQPPTDR